MQLDPKETAGEIQRAFQLAHNSYSEMSGNVWALRYPLERYFSVKIAEHLWETFRGNHGFAVTLEEYVVYLFSEAANGNAPREWITEFGSRGNIDIALWFDEKAIGMVEVKRWGNNREDVRRLGCIFNRLTDVQCGFMPFAIEQKAPAGKDCREELSKVFWSHIGFLQSEALKVGLTLNAPDPIAVPSSLDVVNEGHFALVLGCAYLTR